MVALDFLLTLFLVYGVVKLIGAMFRPSRSVTKAPRVAKSESRKEVPVERESRTIVDASFEEIE